MHPTCVLPGNSREAPSLPRFNLLVLAGIHLAHSLEFVGAITSISCSELLTTSPTCETVSTSKN